MMRESPAGKPKKKQENRRQVLISGRQTGKVTAGKLSDA
jgi:hypothetical protein